MTLEQIDRMVRQANPVPDLTALEPIDAAVLDEQRRTEMQTHDRVIVDDEGGGPKRGRNLLIGIAAAVAIMVGALLLLRPLTDEPPVADQPTMSAIEIATAFVEAYAAYDREAAAAYLAADATVSIFGDAETWELGSRYLQAIGAKLFIDPCEATGTSTVRCPFDYQAFRSDEIGLGPYTGSYFDVVLEDRKITSVAMTWIFLENGWSSQVWEPFADWVAETHPDDVPVLYTDDSQTMERVAEDSIPLWEQRTREYVEVAPSLKAAAEAEALAAFFVGAYAAFDVDQAASYLASDADLWLSDLEQVRLENRLLESQGFQLLLDSCEQRRVTTDGIVVGCSWDFHAIRSDEMGLGPFSGSWFDLTVRDGEIVAATMNWGISEFSPQVWEPFAAWVAENHPEDVDIMYVSFSNYRLTDESIALWEQRSREYAESVGG